MIDYATLTGACVYALTERYSGAFTNRPELRDAIESAGTASGERVWCFPMDKDFDSDLESTVADVMQCAVEGKGDHILAARFLSRFVPKTIPWLHLDLAAGSRHGGLAHIATDITGFGVRFTLELLRGWLGGSAPLRRGGAPGGAAAARRALPREHAHDPAGPTTGTSTCATGQALARGGGVHGRALRPRHRDAQSQAADHHRRAGRSLSRADHRRASRGCRTSSRS